MEKKGIIKDLKKIKNKLDKINKVFDKKSKLIGKIYKLGYRHLKKLKDNNEEITKEVIDQAHAIASKIEQATFEFKLPYDGWYIWKGTRNDFYDELEELEKQAKGKK